MFRTMMIVGCVAFLFRLLFILWGLTGRYVIPENTMTSVYFCEGYGICAGYGYVSEAWRQNSFKTLLELKARVEGGLRITPETAPQVDAKQFFPEMLHPPGMALLIAAIHWTTGASAALYFEIIGMFLDTAAACLFFWIVWEFFSKRVAFTAGLVYALYPALAFSSTLHRLPEGIMPLFIMASLVFVLRSARSSGGKALWWWILAGTMLGISAYLRPDYFFVPVVYGFGLLLYTRRFWRSALAVMTMQAVVIVLLLPWAYRNYQLCGRWVFTSTAVGWTLVGGLGEYHNPWGFVGIDEWVAKQAYKQGFYAPESPEADVYFRGLFWESIRSKPWGYVVSVIKRLPMAILAPQETGFKNPCKTVRFRDSLEQGQDRYQVVLSRPFYIIKAYWEYLLMAAISVTSLLCSLAMLIVERRRFGLVFLLLSPHLYAIGVHVLTHYEPRFVLPSMFSFLLGLAYVLSRGWRDRETPGPACQDRHSGGSALAVA
jgi:4-amino-4-deoxy-L-arabinose transferase-like glycosyltransferase